MERPAPCFEQPLKKRFNDDSSDGPLGTWVPAFEEAASSLSSLET
jgi:hypothetical protein